MDKLTLTIAIILGVVLGGIILFAAVQRISRFSRTLRDINMEIARTEGEEQAYWRRKKRKAWRSLLCFSSR